MIKILIDIGDAVARNIKYRTGIFRVTEKIIDEIQSDQRFSLNFYTSRMEKFPTVLSYFKEFHKNKKEKLIWPVNINSFFKRKYMSLWAEIKKEIARKENPSSIYRRLLKRMDVKISSSRALKMARLKAEDFEKFDIYQSMFGVIPKEVKETKNTIQFIMIYDLIPVLYPKFFSVSVCENFKLMLNSIDKETYIFCISESTKRDLLAYHKQIDPQKVKVVYLGADARFYPCKNVLKISKIREKYLIPKQFHYILAVNTIEKRKNIEGIIDGFINILKHSSRKDVCLVLVGKGGQGYEDFLHKIRNARVQENRIIFTGYVPDDDLAPLYSGACFFAYPAFYEGFGLPLLEAMQCGTPVITSNTSSLPEVVGDAGIMVDPYDQRALSNQMLRLYENEQLNNELKQKSINQAKKFSWKKTGLEITSAYENALNIHKFKRGKEDSENQISDFKLPLDNN